MSEIPYKITKETSIVLDNYPVDKASLTRSHKSRLRTLVGHIASTMRRKREVILGLNIKVVGHTDTTGTEVYNLHLGNSRAQQVVIHLKALLMGKVSNVPYINFSVLSEGEVTPVATNKTKRGRGNNRRVDILLEWKEQINTRKSVPKKKEPKKKMPKLIEPEYITPECIELNLFMLGKFHPKLWDAINIYESTTLRYENGKLFLTVSNRKGGKYFLLDKLFDRIKKKHVTGPIKKGIQEWIDSRNRISNNFVGKIGAIFGAVETLKRIQDDIKNTRLMSEVGAKADSAREYKHKKLACASAVNEDLGTGKYYPQIMQSWEKLDRLINRCSESNRKRGDYPHGTTEGRKYINPPTWLDRGLNR